MTRVGLLTVTLYLLALAPPAQGLPDELHDYAVDAGGILYKVDCTKLKIVRLGQVKVPLLPKRTPARAKKKDAPRKEAPKKKKEGKPAKKKARVAPPPPPETPYLVDLAATPDGYLYGVSTKSLYMINLTHPHRSRKIGDHGLGAPYGMGLVGGKLLVNTRGGEVYLLDPRTARTTRVGAMGSGFGASGDLTLYKGKLLSSVKDGQGREQLVEIDPKTGRAKLIGRLVPNVFGMVVRKGVLYGLTSNGAIVKIDPKTARCKVLKQTDVSWAGATTYFRM